MREQDRAALLRRARELTAERVGLPQVEANVDVMEAMAAALAEMAVETGLLVSNDLVMIRGTAGSVADCFAHHCNEAIVRQTGGQPPSVEVH